MKKPLFKMILTAFVLCLLNSLLACTFLPGVQDEQPYISKQCELVTRQLDLNAYLGTNKVDFFNDGKSEERIGSEKKASQKKSGGSGFKGFGEKGDEALLAIIAAWAGVTFIVFGSVVVTGNVLNWTEYQGRCDESELRQFVYRL